MLSPKHVLLQFQEADENSWKPNKPTAPNQNTKHSNSVLETLPLWSTWASSPLLSLKRNCLPLWPIPTNTHLIVRLKSQKGLLKTQSKPLNTILSCTANNIHNQKNSWRLEKSKSEVYETFSLGIGIGTGTGIFIVVIFVGAEFGVVGADVEPFANHHFWPEELYAPPTQTIYFSSTSLQVFPQQHYPKTKAQKKKHKKENPVLSKRE